MKNTHNLAVKFQHLLIYCSQKNKDNMIYASSIWQKHRVFFFHWIVPIEELKRTCNFKIKWFFFFFHLGTKEISKCKQPVKSEEPTAAISLWGWSVAAQCCLLSGDGVSTAQRRRGSRTPKTVIAGCLCNGNSITAIEIFIIIYLS